ncbi:primosomal protein N' [Synechococcus sp. PCC 7336]|uniref:primosomal protein N' n=1 Tax=Synechococcus sp. PCC 7336 TaxID=195250 RepID=UPI0003492B44|nr:primosomal protein N' [Synechococcus sp. PCC 7336]
MTLPLFPTEDSPTQWVEAIVDRPGSLDCYTYRLPDRLAGDTVQPGDVLAVPFGSQTVGAIALRILDRLPKGLDASQVKDVEDVVATGLLPEELRWLLERVSEYYATSLQQVVRAVLPPGILTRSQRRIRLTAKAAGEVEIAGVGRSLLELLREKKGDLSWLFVRRTVKDASKGLRQLQQRGLAESYWQEAKSVKPKVRQVVTLCGDDSQELTPRQAEVLAALQRLGGELWLSEFLVEAKTTRGVVQALAKKGRVAIAEREMLRSAIAPDVNRDRPKTLTAAQAAAVEAIANASNQTLLLQGVTGSGKTEVYLQAIATVLERQQSALVLVPEIGLTPQLSDRFRARFGDRVLVYHSNLSTGERYDTWRHMLGGEIFVVIGTRSAVFAPIQNLGLAILDEEHDDSYKQDQPQPCYHARTVARWRSQRANCPLVLGTATPSLESYTAVVGDPGRHLVLPERIGAKPLPPIEVVDLRQEFDSGNRSVLSRPLREAIADVQASGEQAILFLPRRGYSTFVQCRSCGYAMTCPHCTVSLTFHQVGQQLRCHYCGYRCPQARACPECQSLYFKQFGTGTQRIVDKVQQEFPQLRLLRFDRDTTRQKDGHRKLLDRFRAKQADVLVGTQMLTKGIDIPEVTLVGVLAADGLLNQADFRAGERAFQLLTQVAGRAGRGDRPGRVILQTYLPEHPTIAHVRSYCYGDFAIAELEQRQALGYPPFRRLICVRVSSQERQKAEEFSLKVAQYLSDRIPGERLGPCPAEVERVAGWWRWQILLKEPMEREWEMAELSPLLLPLPQRTPDRVRLSIDVEPLRLL